MSPRQFPQSDFTLRFVETSHVSLHPIWKTDLLLVLVSKIKTKKKRKTVTFRYDLKVENRVLKTSTKNC